MSTPLECIAGCAEKRAIVVDTTGRGYPPAAAAIARARRSETIADHAGNRSGEISVEQCPQVCRARGSVRTMFIEFPSNGLPKPH